MIEEKEELQPEIQKTSIYKLKMRFDDDEPIDVVASYQPQTQLVFRYTENGIDGSRVVFRDGNKMFTLFLVKEEILSEQNDDLDH